MAALNTVPKPVEHSSPALYEQVKAYIRQKSRSGEWKPGDRIPSENDLVRILGISRMTVNRALREMSDEGDLTRRAGVGTFLAESRPSSTLLMIARIGDEIRARGHRYHWAIVLKAREKADAETAAALGIRTGAPLFHLTCVHYENGVPVQLEDRYVNPAAAPRFLQQTFADQTPGEYLLTEVPADEIEHTVDAVLPGPGARLLKITRDEPCLLLTRRTWAGAVNVTFVRLLYPASRYRLNCRFRPSATQEHG
jgi:GntR family transcriptional regulator, histidine utilization repressor